MSEIQLAAQMACHDVYAPVTEGVFDSVLIVNEDVVGVKRIAGDLWIVPAGTENKDGWLNDADIQTDIVPCLGFVHRGFNQNVDEFVKQILPLLRPGGAVKIAGHSRGAPIGILIGAQLKMAGFNVHTIYLFESPKMCYQDGANWLAANIVNIISTRCVSKLMPLFGDPVTMFPEPAPWQPWVAPAAKTLIYGNPKGLLKLSAIAYHSGQVVIDAVNTM